MLQPGVSAARLLENLPPRPPTPPRESDNTQVRRVALASHRVQTHTSSNRSQSPSSEPVNFSIGKSQKKVSWTEVEEYSTSPRRDSARSAQPLRLLQPSAERKPVKSILKPFNGVPSVDRSAGATFGPPHTYPNLATMLESVVKQLAGDDRSSRLDAYMTLSSVLKAAENIPDVRALKEKMGLLMQFIQRDMSAKSVSGAFDTALISNALVFLSALVWKPVYSECLSTEFGSFVVDYAIESFKDPLLSKDIVKHLLSVIGQHTFSAKMTSSRVGRMIESLFSLEGRVKGRSIVLARLAIYRKLVCENRLSMLTNLSWIKILCADMVNSMKDVRTAAIAFGFEAAIQLGAEKQISRAVLELFSSHYDDGIYAVHYANRLDSMIQSKHEGVSVPQIWSIIILFLRSRPQQLEYWEFMTLWLKIIQECFNKSDREIRLQANLAWNRLVFAVLPDEKTTPTMIKILGQALGGQLKRRPVGKLAKEERQMAIASICNLLYYSLRPNATAAQLDLYWDEYVVRLVGKMLVSPDQSSPTEQNDLTYACAITASLFDTGPKAWIFNRATEIGAVQVEELPNIDPKWIRKNVQRIFTVLEPLVEKCFMDLRSERSPISLAWKNFATSVASAGAKEVKVSNDTMIAVAFIFNTFHKIWLKGPNYVSTSEEQDSTVFCTAFTALIITVITSLGVLPFTEKLLSIDSEDIFTIVSTPSHSPKKMGEVRSPLYHLFTFLIRPPLGLSCGENYLRMVKNILYPFFETRRSRRSCIEFLNDLCQYIPLSASSSPASTILWQALANFATIYIRENEESIVNSSGSYDQPSGVVYRNIVKILQVGVSLSPNEPLSGWTDLFVAVSAQVALEAGECSRSISIIEPISRVLHVIPREPERYLSLRYCSLLVSNAAFPKDRQSLDMARCRLWGTATAGSKPSSFDPFLHLYSSLRQILVQSYQMMASGRSDLYTELLLNTADLVKRCPVDIIVNLLKNIQEGIVPWVLDEALKYGSRKLPEIATSVVKLWENICFALKQLPQTNTGLLRTIEPLLCSALSSMHKSTVSIAVVFWNSTFGGETQLEYPPQVREVLLKLRSTTNLQLPPFLDDVGEVTSTGPVFQDCQENNEMELPIEIEISELSENQDPSLNLNAPPLLFPSCKCRSKVSEVSEAGSKRCLNGTPEQEPSRTSKKNITPQLGHANSQIQFAPINSPVTATSPDYQILAKLQAKQMKRAEKMGYLTEPQASHTLKNSGLSKFNLGSGLATVGLGGLEDPETPSLDVFIPSSPTPRRGNAVVESPSSHPEPTSNYLSVVQSQRSEDSKDDFDSALHPTGREKASSTSTYLGPSAQVVDYLVNTSDFNSSIKSPRESKLIDDHHMPAIDRKYPPNTHARAIHLNRRDVQTPIETFVDAVSTLPSSSGPDSLCNSSYSISELDDSSLLRLMTEFDNSIDEPDANIDVDAESQHLPHKADDTHYVIDPTNYSVATPQETKVQPTSDCIVVIPVNEASQPLGDHINRNTKSKSSRVLRSSRLKPKALFSSIPETPQNRLSASADGDNEELECSSKIVATEDHASKTTRSSSTSEKRRIAATKKRKATEENSEIPDSQDAKAIDSLTSRKRRKRLEKPRSLVTLNGKQSETEALCRETPLKQEMAIQKEGTTANSTPCDPYIGCEFTENGSTELAREQELCEKSTTAEVNEIIPSPLSLSSRFEGILEDLRTAVLRRDEVEQIEDILWDVKGELYAAEKRGRQVKI